MNRTGTSIIFSPPMKRWSLRGDEVLWQQMASDLTYYPLPKDDQTLEILLIKKFKELTGATVPSKSLMKHGDEAGIYIPELNKGGMSGGMVDPFFWRDHGMPELLARFRRLSGDSTGNPTLDSNIIEKFVSFFSGEASPEFGLPKLKAEYNWPIKQSIRDYVGGLPQGNGYYPNRELKLRLNKKWINSLGNLSDRKSLAKRVIQDWGGVNRNKDETLQRYVKMAEHELPGTPIKGVASYSKLLSVAHPEKYAIYDARVAVALNAVQLLMGLNGIVFPYVAGRNNVTGNKQKKQGFSEMEEFAPNALESQGWSVIDPSCAYQTYIELLKDVNARFAERLPLYNLEMTLFSQAEDLALAVKPSLVCGVKSSKTFSRDF